MNVVNYDWNPTEEERKKMPSGAFLLPGSRKYPVKIKINPETGKRVKIDSNGIWVYSCKMLKDALLLAIRNKQKEVEIKAKRLIKRYCKE